MSAQVMNVVTYLKEVRGELDKVIWPPYSEVLKLTITVLLISTIVGAYLGGLDFAFTKLLELVLANTN